MGRGRVMLAGAAAGVAAWAWFAHRPDVPVLVGRRRTAWCAPPLYQASAFPAFGSVIAQGAEDLLDRGDERRLLLAAISGVVGAKRLRGWIPYSGHALFLGAALAFETVVAPRSPATIGYALGGLAVTFRFKARWKDLAGASCSLALGGLLGTVLGMDWQRPSGRSASGA